MPCTFDRELISLYVNDDLNHGGREATAEHLRTCAECRQIASQYKVGADALAEAVAATPVPALRPRRPARRYAVPAAAAALLVALLVTTQAQALGSKLIQLFPFLQVVELTPEEVADIGRSVPPPPELDESKLFSTVAEVEQQFGFDVAQPQYVPEGWLFQNVRVTPPNPPTVTQYWALADKGAALALLQMAGDKFETQVPEGVGQEVTVLGGRAMLIDGAFVFDEASGEPKWVAEGFRRLVFQWQGKAFTLLASFPEPGTPILAGDELIRIAESLQ